MPMMSADQILVSSGIKKLIQISCVFKTHLADPTLLIGTAVDHGGISFQFRVDGNHFTPEWCIDRARRLDGLDGSCLVTTAHRLSNGGQFHEDHVAQFFLSMIRNTNRDDIVFEAYPLMIRRVPEIVWNIHCFCWVNS